MSYTVKVTIDSVETDITAYVVRGSVSRDFILHKDLKPTTSTAGFKVLGSYRTLLDSLLLSKAEVPCTILKDSSPYFTGIISPKYSLKAAQARAEQVSIQVEDFNVSRLKRKIDSNVKLTGNYISDPVTPGQSIIHALASLAGVGVDATTAPSIPIQVPIYVVLSDEDKKYEDELTSLLYSYGYVYYFNESGELAFYYFGDYDTSVITTGFKNIVGDSGSNCLEAIKVEKSRETYDKIKLKWYELELKADQVLFEDTTDGDAEGCNIELDSGEYYPDGSGEANVYSEYDLEGLVGAVEAALQATYDSGISIATAFVNYGKKALFALQSSADNKYITKLRIVGDAYVQKSKNFTIETINADVQNILDYESLYIFDKANAEAFGLILHNYYQYSDFNYLIKSKSTFALGAYVKIEDDIHLSFTAYGRIREIKDDSEGIFTYYIEGITEYIAVGDSSTVKNQSPTTLASKVAQVIGGIGLMPPDNNVTDVVFEEAQNADGSVRVTATWNYVQGTNKADAAFIYYKGSVAGAPDAFDYALDSAAAKPMDVNGEYSWSGNFPGRTGGSGGAPIRWRFGIVAARFSLLHSAGAVTPTGWDDKTLVPVIQDIDFNLYDKAFTSYEGPGDYRRAVRVSGNKISWLDAPEGDVEEEKLKMFRAPNESRVRIEGTIGKYDNTLSVAEKTISATARNWDRGAWSPSLGLYVIVAFHSTTGTTICATSPDGVTWTERTISATARKWFGICWSQVLGLFIICSLDSTVCATSPDGVTWTERTISATARDWYAVEWCSGLALFLMIQVNGTICATSPDGITWTERTISATTRGWSSIAWSESLGRAVISAMNSSVCATSEDGITWTERQVSSTVRSWRGAVRSDSVGIFVMCATGSTVCATSPDGITWTERTISATSRYWNYTVFCPGFEYFFMVSGDNSGSTVYATSPDGVTWTERTVSETARYWYGAIASPEQVKVVFLAQLSVTVCALVTNIGYQEIQTEEVFTPGDCTLFMPAFRPAYNATISDGSGGYYHLNRWVSEAWGQGGTSTYLPEYWPSYSTYGTPTTLTNIFEHKLKSRGTYRIQFSLTRWAGSGTVYAQVYKNGSAFGTLRSRATTGTWNSWSEDLSFEKGDLLQIYFRVSNTLTGGNIGKVRIKVAEHGQIE